MENHIFRKNITKSKRGHYCVTIIKIGFWESNGIKYPSNKVVFKENKISNLGKARDIADFELKKLMIEKEK